MKTLYNISVGLRNLIALPFKFVGILAITTGIILPLLVSGVLFPEKVKERMTLLNNISTSLKELKDDVKKELEKEKSE